MRKRKKFSQGLFEPANPKKYVGTYPIRYRSSWELVFMNVCDSNPAIKQWASESIKIQYRHPFTGRISIYVPDFLVHYDDKKGKSRVEIIEIKPLKQTLKEKARGTRAKMVVAINKAKWSAANQWCKRNGMVFRVMTEMDMFAQAGGMKK